LPLDAPSPAPVGAARDACLRLGGRLPTKVDSLARRSVVPSTQLVAAWGDPAVILRCGVPRPTALIATSQLIGANDVDWFAEETPQHRIFTTFGRAAYVEVSIPTQHDPAVGPLVDLAAAISAADPLLPAQS
jgi:hypothetical protein